MKKGSIGNVTSCDLDLHQVNKPILMIVCAWRNCDTSHTRREVKLHLLLWCICSFTSTTITLPTQFNNKIKITHFFQTHIFRFRSNFKIKSQSGSFSDWSKFHFFDSWSLKKTTTFQGFFFLFGFWWILGLIGEINVVCFFWVGFVFFVLKKFNVVLSWIKEGERKEQRKKERKEERRERKSFVVFFLVLLVVFVCWIFFLIIL